MCRYRLAVLTHGDGPCLEETLESFARHVTPLPTSVVMLRDGDGWSHVPRWFREPYFAGQLWSGPPRGFCEATRALWGLASGEVYGDDEYVFWLEHDFRFERDVDLAAMASVLDAHSLVQMSLMRQPVSPAEIRAGGVMQQKRYSYAEHRSGGERGPYWIEHRHYFTTNPSLMRRDWMQAHPWPYYEAECEGRFGNDLKAEGALFGVWGSGERWVTHIGRRDGRGY